MKTVLITDKKHTHYNERLEGFCAYYDLYHTGNGPDLYILKTIDGEELRLLSDQIDVEDYKEQEKAQTLKAFGVKEGDVVMISRTGSGSFSKGFDINQPHLITDISYNGNVVFDHGKANCFRPDMTKYDGDIPVQTDFIKVSSNNGLPF